VVEGELFKRNRVEEEGLKRKIRQKRKG